MVDKSENNTIKITFPLQDIQVWQRFCIGLKTENRFTLSEEPARFVDLIIDYAKTHKTVTLSRNTLLYRARINDSNNTGAFTLDQMGAPSSYLAGHGRLNPRGIPYLYLASDQDTAVSEVRPWVGCDLTVAEFSLIDDCELVNFSTEHFLHIPEGEQFKGPEFSWNNLIAWMFSSPFDPRDDTAYIPTQYLSERIKGAGFAGIIYDSALNSGGYNVTLFDVNGVNAIRREKATVKKLQVESQFVKVP